MDSSNKNIIGRLWCGEVTLVKTYWLWGVLANIVLNIVVGLSPLINETLVIIASAFTVVYAIFISVAIWRSATRYEGKVLWKYLAKVAVILPLLGFGVGFILSKVSMPISYQSSNECMYKELKKSELQNVQIAINNIGSYCHANIAENLNKKLNNQYDIKKMLADGYTYTQVSEALFNGILELKKYPKRESYTRVSECNFDLTKGIVGSKEKELFMDVFAKAYCYELVAINLGSKIDYDMYGARKANYSFKEIAEYLEFGKK